MKKINFVNGTTIDGASTFNQMQDNVEEVFNGEESMGSIVVGDITSKNLFYPTAKTETQAGVTFVINSDNTVTANGTATANINFYLNSTFYLDVGSYKFSGCTGGSTSTYRLIAPNAVNTNGDTEVTLTEKTLFPVYINVKSGTTLSNVIFKPMIRLATVVDDTYIPHKKFGYNEHESMGKIVVDDISCKNKLDYGISSKTINGVTFTVNNDKSITINGTATGSADFYLDFNSKPTLNGTYTLSKGINNYAIQLYILNNNNSIFMGGDTQSITSDLTNQQILKLMIRVVNGQTVNNQTIYPQLEKGDKASPYTPHKEFSNKQIYSTNEQVIGTWIDGRNIYKKTIPITFSSSEAYTTVSHGISNFDICIGNEIITPKNAYGISWNSRKDTFMSYISNTEVAIDYPTGTFSGTGYITLYYTKSDTSTASEV